jgi:hypothetical protein|nr:MAG TPA: Protein of unknown function (DUF2635) [Caudoviricetes sp.]
MQVKIKPVNKKRVLDPVTKAPIPEKGVTVELTTYWRRRLMSGEVEIITEKKGK